MTFNMFQNIIIRCTKTQIEKMYTNTTTKGVHKRKNTIVVSSKQVLVLFQSSLLRKCQVPHWLKIEYRKSLYKVTLFTLAVFVQMSYVDQEQRKCWIYKRGVSYTRCVKVFGGYIALMSLGPLRFFFEIGWIKEIDGAYSIDIA